MTEYLITNGFLITWETENRVLEDYALYIVDDRIQEIGPQADMLARHPEVEFEIVKIRTLAEKLGSLVGQLAKIHGCRVMASPSPNGRLLSYPRAGSPHEPVLARLSATSACARLPVLQPPHQRAPLPSPKAARSS